MLVEIHGGGFENKGAQLMLHTVVNRLRCLDNTLTFCVSPTRNMRFEDRAEYCLKSIFPFVMTRYVRSFPYRFLLNRIAGHALPKRFADIHGLARYQDIGAFVDISGYAFGDVFNPDYCLTVARRAEYFKSQGKPVILLPQMFGPFERATMRKAFRKLINLADLVIARDRTSFECLKSFGSSSNIRIAPDITLFVEPDQIAKSKLNSELTYVCIVPNANILTKKQNEWGGIYLDRLVQSVKYSVAAKHQVKILLHGAVNDDEPLAKELLSMLDDTEVPFVEIVREQNPLILKAWLACARYVVSSRFHAVVGALSSGTPCITLGWAHKYERLHEDFGVPNFIHGSSASKEEFNALLEIVNNEKTRSETIDVLIDRKKRQKNIHEEMWVEVANLLHGQITQKFSDEYLGLSK